MESQWRTVLLGILILLLTFGAARSAYSQQAAYGGYAQITGSITTGHCASFASNSQVQDAGAACGTSGANPIYTHTVTESAGAATLVVQSSSVAYTDTDYIALNANLTATTPAAAGMTDGEILYVDGTTSGTPFTVKFTAGSGVTIGSIVTGVTDPTTSTAGCGTTPSTGDIWFAFHWNGSVLTLMGCGIRPPASTIGTSLGGTGADLSAAASGTYPKSNGATPAVYAASSLAAAGTGSCTNQAVTALNGDAAPTCTTLTSAYVNNSIALTGTDINTSNQVTATHLASALPVNQGGTGLATLTAHDVYVGNGTSAPTAISPSTATFVLTSNGTSADPTFQAPAGGLSLTTANVGGWCAPLGNPMLCSGGSNWNNPGVNTVQVDQFVLPFTLKVSSIVTYVATNAASSHCDVGVYSSAGSLLLHSGSLDTSTTGAKATAITPVTLSAGVYFSAAACDNATVALLGNPETSGQMNLLNADFVVFGHAANAATAGVLPSTTGVISGGASENPAVVWMHP